MTYKEQKIAAFYKLISFFMMLSYCCSALNFPLTWTHFSNVREKNKQKMWLTNIMF